MGGIALPALHLNPPAAPPNVMEQYGQLLQLKNAMQNAPLQHQIMQQQAQEGQLENQQRQLQMQDQQTIRAISPEFVKKDADGRVTGYDYNGLFNKAAASGVSAPTISALQKSISEGTLASANASKQQRENADAMLNQAYQHIEGLRGTQDPAMRQQLWGQAAQWAQQNIPSLGGQLPAQAPDDKALDSLEAGLGMHAQQVADAGKLADNAKKKSDAFEADARGNEANVNAALAPQKMANQLANDATLRRQGQQRLSIEAARLKFEQNKAGMSSNGTPSDLSTAIAQGHITPDRMGYLLARNPEILQGVLQVDPSFDSAKAQQYPSTYKDFTSGKTSIALNAGGTALSHLKELSEMNTDASHIPGTPAYNAYQNKADTVASELAKFYGDATIPAIAAIKKTLTATLPGNRQAAIQTQAQSMGDKLDSFQQTWENAAPSKAYQAPMPGISQKAIAARAALDPKYKAGVGGGSAPAAASFSVTAPNGKLYTFKDQASADAFKQKAGIQ